METQEMISPNQAAQVLDVNARTIKRWCEAGRLAGEKQGRVWRVDARAVEALKSSNDNGSDTSSDHARKTFVPVEKQRTEVEQIRTVTEQQRKQVGHLLDRVTTLEQDKEATCKTEKRISTLEKQLDKLGALAQKERVRKERERIQKEAQDDLTLQLLAVFFGSLALAVAGILILAWKEFGWMHLVGILVAGGLGVFLWGWLLNEWISERKKGNRAKSLIAQRVK